MKKNSVTSAALEKSTLRLLLNAQSQHPTVQDKIVTEVIATSKASGSAISTAFCIALFSQNIRTLLDKMSVDCEKCGDHQAFNRAYEEIVRHLLIPFTSAPEALEKSNRKESIMSALFDYATNEEKSENYICKLLIAARLETFGEHEKAVIIYTLLMINNFSPLSQLANLMRIGETSPEALYQIGKYIIRQKFSNEKFKAPLIHFTKAAIRKLLSDQTPPDMKKTFTQFCRSDDPTWDEIGLTCVALAVYNRVEAHASAARYFSQLAMTGEHTRESPNKACQTLEFAYRRSALPASKQILMGELKKFHRDRPDDPWVNSMLGSVYMISLASPRKEDKSEETSVQKAESGYNHYRRVYETLLSGEQKIYGQEFTLVGTLAEGSYELALIILKLRDTNRADTQLAAKLLDKAEYLLEQSGKLGNYKSHWKLTVLKEDRLKQPISEKDLEVIDRHYQCALEAALVALNVEDYARILSSYEHFVSRYFPSHQTLFDQYKARLNDLNSNLEALSGTDKMEALSARSPMACALLWENSLLYKSTYCSRLVELLIKRGHFISTDPNLKETIATLLTDYFILTKTNKTARCFFECLRSALSSTDRIGKSLCAAIIPLIDFYLCIIDDNTLGCKRIVNLSRDYCGVAFSMLDQKILLQPKTYRAILGIFEPKPSEPVSFRPGISQRFFGQRISQEDVDLFFQMESLAEPQKQSALRSLRETLGSLQNSPREPEVMSTSAPATFVMPIKMPARPASKTVAPALPPLIVHPKPKRRFSLPELQKRKTHSAPDELESDPLLTAPMAGTLPKIDEDAEEGMAATCK